ncbi:unnamed protein product [Adineta steineri]|uniref:Uncharacterized protein n=1 Tax=Adineta steineri TaxID=433720 RepID=A0A819K8I5_9BILA|nr:unnamed protein product [Adineta steineri]CAF3942856.1 unnamed protein product [Adineta steineri]
MLYKSTKIGYDATESLRQICEKNTGLKIAFDEDEDEDKDEDEDEDEDKHDHEYVDEDEDEDEDGDDYYDNHRKR